MLFGILIASLSNISENRFVSVHRSLPQFLLQLPCVHVPYFVQLIFMLGHLGSFQYFAMTNNTTANTLVRVHFRFIGGISSR